MLMPDASASWGTGSLACVSWRAMCGLKQCFLWPQGHRKPCCQGLLQSLMWYRPVCARPLSQRKRAVSAPGAFGGLAGYHLAWAVW